jgi:Ca-activated chloride channel family protein
MRRTLAVLAVAFLSLVAAAYAALRPRLVVVAQPQRPVEQPAAVVTSSGGALSVTAQLDRAYVSETGGGEAYLEVDVMAAGRPDEGPRVPVNAVLIVDRSGSMTGPKLQRAKDAARELLSKLNGDDRFALIDFGSDARVLVPSMAATGAAKERALELVERLEAQGGTNLSAALELAAPELQRGHALSRADKIFLASDGQANEGISTRNGLLAVARRAFGMSTTVSTFGVGEDYDEDIMTALAAQAGGLTHFIRTADEIVPAFRAELSRATKAVARDVRLQIRPAAGSRVLSVIGYESDGGWVRLPDFAAGERRRVLVKLELGPGKGTAELAQLSVGFLGDDGAQRSFNASARATYTADARLADKRDNAAAFNGARAEANWLAGEAASLLSAGHRGEAMKKMGRMRALRGFASGVGAVSKKEQVRLDDEMNNYDAMFGQTVAVGAGAPAPAPAKAAKQQAFDVTREAY